MWSYFHKEVADWNSSLKSLSDNGKNQACAVAYQIQEAQDTAV